MTADNEPVVLHARRGGGDGARGVTDHAAPGRRLHHAGARRQLHAVRRRQPVPHAGKDADAIGKDARRRRSCRPTPAPATCAIWPGSRLRTCYDPEIPINIVELGLVYECDVSRRRRPRASQCKMTLTAPGCGMGDVLVAGVARQGRDRFRP